MDEAISRQKVIDKLDEAFERITKNVSKESDAYHIVYGTVDITKCMIMTLPPIQPVIIPCDYAKACNEATMNKLTSAVAYYDALEELRKHGYVLVDLREVNHDRSDKQTISY